MANVSENSSSGSSSSCALRGSFSPLPGYDSGCIAPFSGRLSLHDEKLAAELPGLASTYLQLQIRESVFFRTPSKGFVVLHGSDWAF